MFKCLDWAAGIGTHRDVQLTVDIVQHSTQREDLKKHAILKIKLELSLS